MRNCITLKKPTIYIRLHHLLILFFSFPFFDISFSQAPSLAFELELGAEFFVPSEQFPQKVVRSQEATFHIVYSDANSGTLVRRFDLKSLRAIDFIKLQRENTKVNYTISVSIARDTIYHFMVDFQKEQHIYYLQKTSLGTTKSGEKVLFGRINSDERKAKHASRQLIASPNGEKLAFIHTVPNKAKSQQQLRVTRLDTNFNITDVEEYQFPYQNKEFLYASTKLTNQNEMYVLARIWRPHELESNEVFKYNRYKLFRLTDGQSTEISEFILEKRFLQSFGSTIIDNELIVATCYSVMSPYAIKGTYYVRIDLSTGEVRAENRQGFDLDFFM